MKIEKLNDRQIKCTLTQEDLSKRNLKLSELAYGTDKAKELFRDMMQQASFDFGFEADDSPIMIEAIPSSDNSIVLIITKVDDPEELDTRFSKFTPSSEKGLSLKESLEKLDGAEQFNDLLNKVKNAAAGISDASITKEDNDPFNIRIFQFDSIDTIIDAAHLINPDYTGSNTLYYDTMEDIYVLAITPTINPDPDYSRICNMLSEYGSPERATAATLAFLEEHFEIVIPSDALQKLSSI